MSFVSRALGAALLISMAGVLPAAAQSAKAPAEQSAKGAAPAGKDGGAVLPGGASSLQENYGDWTVVCALPGGHKACTLYQTQADQKTQQRVLAMELSAGEKGLVTGVLALPFGLDLEKGVSLQIGDGAPGARMPFQTCLPVGCIVQLKFDEAALTKLRAAKQVKIIAHTAENDQPLDLAVSLNGFTTALARVRTLL